jgi:3-hydroxymyristoyl/3-hydroxydecanoyl-(acyl carrier protein) dehydratase
MDAVWTHALRIDASHPAFDGHFPGRPVLPGVALLAEVIEAALDVPALARGLGDAPRLVVAKFFSPVAPGTSLAITWQATPRTLDWQVADGARRVASGQFARVDAPATAPA